MYWCAVSYTPRLMSRYQLCDHGGCIICIWFLALSSLAREKASKLTSFLAGLLLRPCAQIGCSKCTYTHQNAIQPHVHVVYIRNQCLLPYYDLQGLPFHSPLYNTYHAYRYRLIESGAAGGERSEPPCLYIIIHETLINIAYISREACFG